MHPVIKSTVDLAIELDWEVNVRKDRLLFISPKDDKGNHLKLALPTSVEYSDFNKRLSEVLETFTLVLKSDLSQ